MSSRKLSGQGEERTDPYAIEFVGMGTVEKRIRGCQLLIYQVMRSVAIIERRGYPTLTNPSREHSST
jgi:hypothetical protein